VVSAAAHNNQSADVVLAMGHKQSAPECIAQDQVTL
jgi:hypothetical protein